MILKNGISDIKKIDFVISQNQIYVFHITSKNLFCDITKSENDFVISLNRYDFVISKSLFCDITK